LRNPVRKALRKTLHISGKTVVEYPSDYIRSFSSEIFAAISMVVGTILGAFFGQKG